MSDITRVARIIVAGLLFLSVSGCSSARPVDGQTGDRITLILGGGSYNSLNPYSPSRANRQVGSLLFRGLTRPSATGEPAPDLLATIPTADNGGLSSDGRRVRLKLRSDAKWSDGEPVTAKDVAFTLSLLREMTLIDDPKFGYDSIESVTVIDPFTIDLALSAPNAPMVWGMVPYVLPSHLLGSEASVASSSFWHAPVGSGAFKVKSLTPGSRALLEPVSEKGPLVQVVFAQTPKQAEKAYASSASAAWVVGVETTSLPSGSVVTTTSAQWRAWVYKQRKGSRWKDSRERALVLSTLKPGPLLKPSHIDPFGNPLPPRTVESTSAVLADLKANGWATRSGKLVKNGKQGEVAVLIPTPDEQTFEWFTALQQAITSCGMKVFIKKADPPNVGGYYDEEYLTRATGAADFDFAYTDIYFGWPLGSGWPFLSTDAPGWSNPYGGNVFEVREPELDTVYRRVLAAGSPDDLASAWRELGRALDKAGIVTWEAPTPVRVVSKGLSGVSVSPWIVSTLETVPEWRLDQP